MLAYMTTWMNLNVDRRAVTALEYGLIAGLIAVVIITGVSLVGTKLATTFTAIGGSI